MAESSETTPLLRDNAAVEDGHPTAVPPPAADDSDAPLADEPTPKELLVIQSSIWLGVFFAALDATVVATISGPISSSFNSLSLLSWLASAYLISNAACQPLSGKLTDIFSRRTGLVVSNVLFGLGNLICGLAQDEWVMIFGRVVAGMGGGGLTAIATFVTSDLVPLRKRGLWQGIGNICYGVGSGLGGVFGGWVNDTWGWRWGIPGPDTFYRGIYCFGLGGGAESLVKRDRCLALGEGLISLVAEPWGMRRVLLFVGNKERAKEYLKHAYTDPWGDNGMCIVPVRERCSL
ncbi:multidrug resistance protein fnx1 [Coccidioides immitis H538.4]|uniref:Multidrug resistance protein fnx1 n=1 Tax=Coccidioides immitis H538.4 TaxID=396776 RepID=A0A0J8REH7_COCIT|nr:multidrug resistance protein fnx1 [Coccidioides immitis H538.4]